MALLKTGDRVAMTFVHETTHEEQIVYGTVTSDEIEHWDWITVDWDQHPIASMFPVARCLLKRVALQTDYRRHDETNIC